MNGTKRPARSAGELARVLYGSKNVFFLHYAVKAPDFSPDARAEWIKRFNEAAITPSEK